MENAKIIVSFALGVVFLLCAIALLVDNVTNYNRNHRRWVLAWLLVGASLVFAVILTAPLIGSLWSPH